MNVPLIQNCELCYYSVVGHVKPSLSTFHRAWMSHRRYLPFLAVCLVIKSRWFSAWVPFRFWRCGCYSPWLERLLYSRSSASPVCCGLVSIPDSFRDQFCLELVHFARDGDKSWDTDNSGVIGEGRLRLVATEPAPLLLINRPRSSKSCYCLSYLMSSSSSSVFVLSLLIPPVFTVILE